MKKIIQPVKRNNLKSRHIFLIMLAILGLSLAVLFISIFNTEFAEWYSISVSAVFRKVLSFVTGFVSFSFFELFVLSLPLILVLYGVFTIKRIKSKKFIFKNEIFVFLSVLSLLAVVFINTFAVCYFRNPLETNLCIERTKLNREDVYESSLHLKNRLEDSIYNVGFCDDGASENPYSWKEMNSIIDRGYDRLCDDYGFLTRVKAKSKKLISSPYLTFTHISGIYIPFTGEANINNNYPDYVVTFTVAHEKAHQRGIAGEDDANFIAFLSLLASGDDYMRYSALMTMYDYFLDSLYINDYEMYNYFLESTDKKILGEMYAYSEFFDKYRNSRISKVADSVNDTYLKSMGEKQGVESYGAVIELFSAYVDKNNGLPY